MLLSGRDSVFVYISSRVGIRFCNAVLGMGRGIFMSVLLGDNSLAKTGTYIQDSCKLLLIKL